MKVKLFDIEYDTDEEQVSGLPNEIITTLEEMGWDEDIDGSPEEYISEYGADYISDKTAWLVFRFKYELVKK